MLNFEELRKEAKKGLEEWHKTRYKYHDFISLIPKEENQFKMDWKDLEDAFPMLINMMKNSPQDPIHHFEGDVWIHTQMVMDEMFSSEFYQSSQFEEQEILFWSAFLHDVAKPITIEKNIETGFIGNPDHSNKGAQDQRLFMWENGFDNALREHVARIIKYHQKPFYWHKKMSVFELRKLSQLLPLNRLIAMARADTKGRRLKENSDKVLNNMLENLELMEYMALEENCLNKPWEHEFNSIEAKKIYFDAEGESHEDRPVFLDKGSDVIFLCGLPASGKNFWVENYSEGRPVLSYDDEREKLGLKSGKGDGQAVQIVKEKAKEFLRKKEPFIFNATHINEELRGKNLNLLSQYGATVRIVHLETNFNELLSRNSTRQDSIPPEAIKRMAKRWTPPSPLEGHETMWWDQKIGKPVYERFLTTIKDEEQNVWNFKK